MTATRDDSASASAMRWFQQIHIDAARNATDDFNPFHDPRKASLIRANPYAGPIVLGFQIECLIADDVERERAGTDADVFAQQHALHYRNYQLTFAGALLPEQRFYVQVKPTIVATNPPALANRVVARTNERIVMIGHVRDTAAPLVLSDVDLATLPPLRQAADRAFVPATSYFLKRKFMNTGNAKNFLAGSLCDQGDYFDELAERVNFPDMFPVALISCALLEKAAKEGHDFLADPMVYIAHTIAVDRRVARRLRSNDVLHMLVEGPAAVGGEKGLGTADVRKLRFNCFGVVEPFDVLYRAEVLTAPLDAIISAR